MDKKNGNEGFVGLRVSKDSERTLSFFAIFSLCQPRTQVKTLSEGERGVRGERVDLVGEDVGVTCHSRGAGGLPARVTVTPPHTR